MSERLLGAIIGVHGDNKGLVIPPEVAPIQVVIIPIIFKGKEKEILDTCDNIHKILKNLNIRSHVDSRDITPGNKYYGWELKGVPLRIEIGPRDLEKNELVIVRRDTFEKISVSQSNIEKTIKDELENIQDRLIDKATDLLNKNINRAVNIEEAKNKKGIVELPWCGTESCALELEEALEGNTLGEPLQRDSCQVICPICGKNAKTWMRYAKTY
jgi:prolyl-tRNA synthetase